MNITNHILWPLGAALLCAGCSSTATVKNTSALKGTTAPGTIGTAYTVLTVMPFTLGPNVTKAEPKFGENFSGDIVGRLRTDYAGLFQEVRWNKATRVPHEAILEGTIRTYVPGSAASRGLLIGLGSSSFEGDIIVKDANDGRVLFSGPFDKLWAWGGMLGGSKTIDNMVSETAVAITKTVALWKQGKLSNQ